MEIIVLVVIWLIATLSASEQDFGFALFLTFASLAALAWRWRAKANELNETLENDARVTDGLKAELQPLTQEMPIELFQAGYSKEQELEADREGIRLASTAGYSATAVSQLFRTMDEQYHEAAIRSKAPQGEMSRVVFATLTEYFRSHPPAAERIAQIEHVAAEDRLPVRQEKPLQVRAN